MSNASRILDQLEARLETIDRKLASHRGDTSPEQMDLLRQRRELILELADLRRSMFGP